MSYVTNLHSEFQRMGARLSLRQLTDEELLRHQSVLLIDVRRKSGDEFFDIRQDSGVRLSVLDCQSRHRHLLLSASNVEGTNRFLCGHDERHWFAAALPDSSKARSVKAAKEALKPTLVKDLESRKPRRKKRKSDVYIRQGEWFFIPCKHASVVPSLVERRASLVRGPGSKPHTCEYLYRDGERQYVCSRFPKIVSESEYRALLSTRRKAKQWGWRQLPFRPDIYVRGAISHPDHATLHLDVWHRVERNTEPSAASVKSRARVPRVVYRD